MATMSPSKGNPLQMATMSPSTLDRTFHKDYAIPINSGSHAVCLAYSHNGDFLASTSMSSVTVRQSQTGSVRAVFTGSSIALTLLWTHSDDTLLCGFHDGIVTTIAFDDKKQAIRSRGFKASDGPVKCISLHPSELSLAVGGTDGVHILVRDHVKASWTRIKALKSPPMAEDALARPVVAQCLAWSDAESSDTLVVSYLHHGLITWSISDNRPLSTSLVAGTVCQLSADGRSLVVSNLQNRLEVYHLQSHIAVSKRYLTPDSQKIDTSTPQLGFDVHDFQAQIPTHPLTIPETEACAKPFPVVFLHNTKTLVVGGIGKVFMWHETGLQVQTLDIDVYDAPLSLATNYHRNTDTFHISIATSKSITLWHTRETQSRRRNSVCQRHYLMGLLKLVVMLLTMYFVIVWFDVARKADLPRILYAYASDAGYFLG